MKGPAQPIKMFTTMLLVGTSVKTDYLRSSLKTLKK